MSTHEHRLLGCRPEPLASYLKALGVLRLVAEQVDHDATGHWAPDGFVLSTTLDDEALRQFLLTAYRPSPLVSPWNNSSGFGPEGAGQLHAIEQSIDPRLEAYRHAIKIGRELLHDASRHEWDKERVLQQCRSRLPEECLPWLDAAAVLTDDRLVFPPLLGTGGNDGRLEFSRNFHQRVLDVLGLSSSKTSNPAGWLEDALFDSGVSMGLRGSSPGQFAPGAAGGANSAATGAADAVLNPWDWVLLLEGTLLLASGSARRLAGNTRGRAAAPFTVDASAGGYSSASESENSRGEFWAPLWGRPTGLGELRSLFAEARADWRGGHGATGLDLAKAASSLGVDRGIAAFSRYALVERNGLSNVAVGVGRFAVKERPGVAPLAQLDGWVDRVGRGSNPPAEVAQGLRSVADASFALATMGSSDGLLRVLIEAASLEGAVSRSPGFRERAGIRPIGGLDAQTWLAAIDVDAAPEVRLAACLASLRDANTGSGSGLLRLLLRPVQGSSRGPLGWSEGAAVVGGFGTRPVTSVLADALAVRSIRAQQAERDDQLTASGQPEAGLLTPLADLADLAAGRVDEDRLGALLAGFLLLDWGRAPSPAPRPPGALPVALALVGPFYAKAVQESPHQGWSRTLDECALEPESSWAGALAGGRLEPVLDGAIRRLRIEGLDPLPRSVNVPVEPRPQTAHRLAAALHCRMSSASRRQLLRAACPDPELDPALDTEAGPALEPEGAPSAAS